MNPMTSSTSDRLTDREFSILRGIVHDILRAAGEYSDPRARRALETYADELSARIERLHRESNTGLSLGGLIKLIRRERIRVAGKPFYIVKGIEDDENA